MRRLPGIFLFFLFVSSCAEEPTLQPDPAFMTWAEIEQAASGTTVHMLMWTGDAAINRYMEGWVVPALKERYNISLRLASVAGPRIVSFVMAEREAGKEFSEADLAWMAGRTSFQMRQLSALYGPYTERLPNWQYVAADDPFIGWDYEIPLEGMQAPWGMGQFLLISDSARVPDPPTNMAELEVWVKANPGRFTLEAGFTTLAFLKALMVEVAELDGAGREIFSGTFNEAAYERYSQMVWDYLTRLKPYMWRRGEAFARSPAQLHQMFANGEVDFTMSYNDGEADNKIAQGLFPETAYGFAWDHGTPRNAHYLSIIQNAPNKAGAMVVVNFLLSPEAQFRKLQRSSWGDGTVLDLTLLPQPWPEMFAAEAQRHHAPQLADIRDRAFLELRPEYIIRLFADYRKHVIAPGNQSAQ
jgi:putative spermidine/putrescine transport system substrate-binding protein